MESKHFDYDEFGAQLAFERDYPGHKEKTETKEEIIKEMKELIEKLENL